MVVARVSHVDPRCPVCSVGVPGIFMTGAVVPPPFPNPEYKRRLRNGETSQGGQHGHFFYHGTHFSPEDDDEHEEDPVVQEAGGRLRTPDWDSEPGTRADEHWNADLGVHFTSLHHVAKEHFAKPQSGDIDSRVAHATLHMQNPKHFDSEHDMTHEAVQWAQKNGLHYLPQHHRAHEEFENGHYAGVADHDPSGTWHEVNTQTMPKMREQREAVSHIDRHGPSWEEGDPNEEDKERYLASHPRRATLTEGYRQHLQSQGHDGVVYGNEHEGPTGHTSAIAFPETPVAIHKWEWFHPDHTRPANAQESAEKMRMAPNNRQLKLFGSVPVPQGYHREYPETWGEGYHRYAQESPHAAAVGQAQEHMRTANPTWGMQMPDEKSATSTARFMLGKAGHPRADTADVMYHPDPEKGTSNTFRRSDGDVGAVLHPDRFDYGTMAHELAHLTHQHELGVTSGRGLSDEESHGPGFMQHYRRMADMVSRGAGDELHDQYQEALKRVQGNTQHTASGTDYGPQTAAVYRVHHTQGIAGMHPALAQSPGETPQEAGETLKGMLHHLGHPDADYAFVIRHPKPEKGISSTVYSDGDPGVALHPKQWTNEYLAHEAAHLMENHTTGRQPGTPLEDEANHGAGFQGHLRSALNYLSPETKDFPGAGDDFLDHVQHHMKASKTATSDWNFQHYNIEGSKHWRSFGGPADNPRAHMLEYQKTPEGRIDFSRSMLNERSEQKDPEAHTRMRQNALEHHNTTEHNPASEKPAEPPKPQRRVYYHGTTVSDVTHVLPATHHGQGVVFRNVTSPEHAYASTKLDDAWDYAQKAFDFKGGRPRVYQVRPIGGHKNVEKDPMRDEYGNLRGNNESDFRSKHGFHVVREMKPPKHVRDSYTDEEWGEDD